MQIEKEALPKSRASLPFVGTEMIYCAGLQAATPANAPGKAEGRVGRDSGGTTALRLLEELEDGLGLLVRLDQV